VLASGGVASSEREASTTTAPELQGDGKVKSGVDAENDGPDGSDGESNSGGCARAPVASPSAVMHTIRLVFIGSSFSLFNSPIRDEFPRVPTKKYGRRSWSAGQVWGTLQRWGGGAPRASNRFNAKAGQWFLENGTT
jgi:hypothetical protein